MTPQEIADRLTELHTELVRKIEAQPFVTPTLYVGASGRVSVPLCRDYNGGEYEIGRAKGESFDEALREAAAIIADLPEPEDRKARDFMAALGKVIDLGRQNGIEVDFINPLKSTMDRMSKNILTNRSSTA